jgi:hypothetical protein
MFNSPILDVTIGLVFIFLLYSLLVTSINEAIASVFSLRARMLRNAIVDKMFSRTEPGTRWSSISKGVGEFYQETAKIIGGKRITEAPKKYGDRFYEHPLIQHYGSSKVFSLPSYIPARNFSAVVIDMLKEDYKTKMDGILQQKSALHSSRDLAATGAPHLHGSDIMKIKDLIEYYRDKNADQERDSMVDQKRDTNVAKGSTVHPEDLDQHAREILTMLLAESKYNLEEFTQKLENWFDDTMNRVSGWYKRQTQTILFILGLTIAAILNVDTIAIVDKLSTDDAARERLVQLAIQASDKYKDDPRVKKMAAPDGSMVPDTSAKGIAANQDLFKFYQTQLDSIKSEIQGDIKQSGNILALGWGNPEDDGGFWSKLLGFLITAFAISLGAPFWFDLLNKLIKLRASGKKEGEEVATGKDKSGTPQPLTLNINSKVGDKAVG